MRRDHHPDKSPLNYIVARVRDVESIKVNEPQVDTTVDNAIKILVDHGVIASPDYWMAYYKNVKYLDQLIINMAAKLGQI